MDAIKFKPLLKQTIWGGNRIAPFKHLDCGAEQIGESWEISGVKGNETTVAGGEHDGMSLNSLVASMKDRLLGKENYRRFGDEFPLLIKFIDAAKDLSIQVHPDDVTARLLGEERGKTEMWYVMDSMPGARLRVGLRKRITPEEYKALVANGTICDAITEYQISEGDCFFIPAGRIHSIGTGCFLAEIQQTSDVTYRIYDFGRKDKNGNYRELHTEKAARVIDYTVGNDYRTAYTKAKNQGVPLVSCPYFSTAVYDLNEPMTIDYSGLDSFVILIGVKGEGRISGEDGGTTSLNAGEAMLLPAVTDKIHVDGKIKFLETYVI